VTVEVALEVEVGQRLINTNGEERTERAIGLDVVLVLQLVGLDVLVNGLGDLRAAHQSASGAGEEGEELSGDLSRALEDGRGTLDLDTVLIEAHTAAALASILHLTVDTLLELLDLAKESGSSLTKSAEVSGDGTEVIIERCNRGRRGSGGGLDGGRGHNDGCSNRGCSGGCSSGGLGGAAGLGCNGNCRGGNSGCGSGGRGRGRGSNSYISDGSNSGNSLLSDATRGLGGRGRHYTGR